MPTRLYKYLPSARLDVLTHGMIRHTQPSALNDPFEVRPYVSSLAPHEYADRSLTEFLPEEVSKVYDGLPQQVRALIPMSRLMPIAERFLDTQRPAIHAFYEQITPMIRGLLYTKLDELIGILSLSEVRDDLLMWSHYAECHAGLVVGFDPAHSWFRGQRAATDEFHHLRRVEYRDQRPHGPLVEQSGIEVFLVKSPHWAYEKEWRVIRPLRDASKTIVDADQRIHLFRFPPESVTEIILGSRLGPQQHAAIRELVAPGAQYEHVVVREAIPDEREFRIRIEAPAGVPRP
jgi:hypothetical protein